MNSLKNSVWSPCFSINEKNYIIIDSMLNFIWWSHKILTLISPIYPSTGLVIPKVSWPCLVYLAIIQTELNLSYHLFFPSLIPTVSTSATYSDLKTFRVLEILPSLSTNKMNVMSFTPPLRNPQYLPIFYYNWLKLPSASFNKRWKLSYQHHFSGYPSLALVLSSLYTFWRYQNHS